MSKLTKDDRFNLKWAWEDRGDITDSLVWKEMQNEIQAEYPELVAAVTALRVAERTLDAVVYRIFNEEPE